ncbi:YdcF family protein [Streptococcus merionis]|uniref:YdcF family protein n=1 Tax=Streptococcus merionis TaxID=400065 RepID=UPI0026EAE5DF|nr:YdcF family protein [Streptococcus merionis]
MSYFFFASILLFLGVYYWERRTIWLGILFWLMVLSTYIYFWPHLQYPSPLFYLTIIPIVLGIGIGPVIFGIFCLYKSFQLLHREGRRWSNFLSLGLGLVGISLLFSYSFLGLYAVIENNYWLFWPYLIFTLLVLYLLAQLVFFTTAAILNNLPIRTKNLDYVVILGAGLINGKKVTPLLASRINKGIKIYRRNPKSKLILSGGQGPDERISEAEAMQRYAISQGVPEEDILLETQSKSTQENIRFSRALVAKEDRIAIVTNYYHLFRALTLARKEKISCIGYGAKTKFYFSLNAFVREFVGYLVQTKIWQILTFLALVTAYFVVYVIR